MYSRNINDKLTPVKDCDPSQGCITPQPETIRSSAKEQKEFVDYLKMKLNMIIEQDLE